MFRYVLDWVEDEERGVREVVLVGSEDRRGTRMVVMDRVRVESRKRDR